MGVISMNTNSKIALFAGANLLATMGVVGFVVMSSGPGDDVASKPVKKTETSKVVEVVEEDGTTKWVRGGFTKPVAPPAPQMEEVPEVAPKLVAEDQSVTRSVRGAMIRPRPRPAVFAFGGEEDEKVAEVELPESDATLPDIQVDEPAPELEVAVVETRVKPQHVIPEKPSYAKIYVGGMGDTVNAFMDTSAYSLEVAAEDDVPDVSFQVYPYEGNSFRLTDYPGFCGRVAVAESGNETYMWVPDHIDPQDGILGEISPLVSDPVKLKFASAELSEYNVGIWVLCGKREDRIPPFYDMRVLEQLDGMSLGNPTYIF